VALIPASVFIVGVIVFTLFAFGYFWSMPLQMR
jgi:hypothetical protein